MGHGMAEKRSQMPYWQKFLGSCPIGTGKSPLWGDAVLVVYAEKPPSGVPGEDIPREVLYPDTYWKAAHRGGTLGSGPLVY